MKVAELGIGERHHVQFKSSDIHIICAHNFIYNLSQRNKVQ